MLGSSVKISAFHQSSALYVAFYGLMWTAPPGNALICKTIKVARDNEMESSGKMDERI